MRTPFTPATVLALTVMVATVTLQPSTAAGQTRLVVLNPTPRPQDTNHKIGGVSGFSASLTQGPNGDQYRIYATSGLQRARWLPGFNGLEDMYFTSGLCPWYAAPSTWDARCIDQIGFFWKDFACFSNSIPCEWNGTWNAYPGINNMSAFPLSWLWPNPPNQTYGVNGFEPVIGTQDLNAAIPTPPPTGAESACHRFNVGTDFTSAANSKAVEVRYPNGASRWFMAFNGMVHVDDDRATVSTADRWRVNWAYSNDGKSWTVYSQILFRDASEANTMTNPCLGLGLLATDMMTDGGWFYLTLTRLFDDSVFLLRSRIDSYSPSGPGFTGSWQIASGLNAYGRWTWSYVPLGQQVDFVSLGADVMPLPPGTTASIRQAAITRVFRSPQPFSSSVYVGLAAEKEGAGEVLWTYTTTSLNRPFVRRAKVDLGGIKTGLWGAEFAFTHYPDNVPATPRVIDDLLDFWFVADESDPSVPWDYTRSLTLRRFTARIDGL